MLIATSAHLQSKVNNFGKLIFLYISWITPALLFSDKPFTDFKISNNYFGTLLTEEIVVLLHSRLEDN